MTKQEELNLSFWENPSRINNEIKNYLINIKDGNVLANREDLEIYKPQRPKDLGMSGSLTRKFLNGMCSVPGTSYLEAGLASGSTFCAATAKNIIPQNQFVGVEAWNPSHFRSGNKMKKLFFNNFKKYVDQEIDQCDNVEIIQENIFNLNFFKIFKDKNLRPVNFYFYDADHSENATWWGLTTVYNILSNNFIYVVDDWNDYSVRQGAFKAIKSLGLSVHGYYQMLGLAGPDLLKPTGEKVHSEIDPDTDFADYFGFFNGLGIFVLEKNPNSLFEKVIYESIEKDTEDVSRMVTRSPLLQDEFGYVEDPILRKEETDKFFWHQDSVMQAPGRLQDLRW